MVCRSEHSAEETYLQGLLRGGAEDRSLEGLLEGPVAVCVTYLSRASLLAEGWLLRALVEVTREALSNLEADLRLYVRHSNSDEPWGKEHDSWKRIVAKMVGPSQP
jgi:hypothetical protein